jgi:DNA-nicking Smr family endonuclease
MIFKKMPGERFMEEIRIPIEGTLDLHAFLPQEAKSVVEEYLFACREQGIYEVKIIHGKGKGVLARTIQSLLKSHPDVIDFSTDTGPSGWGATIVHLKNKTPSSDTIL